jgi:hypothetical protein
MQLAHPARPSGAPYIESPRRFIHKINKSQCLLRSLICCALTSNAARRAALGAPPADAPPPTPPPPACKARKLMATRKCHGLAREIPVSDTLRSPGAVFSATRPCRWARTWQRARRPGSRRACPRPACADGLARGSATQCTLVSAGVNQFGRATHCCPRCRGAVQHGRGGGGGDAQTQGCPGSGEMAARTVGSCARAMPSAPGPQGSLPEPAGVNRH